MKRTLLPILLLASAFELGGCDFTAAERAFNEFDVIISLDDVSSFVSLKVVDGQTLNFVDEEVAVRFAGEDGEHVIDMFSDPMTQMTIRGGLGSFGLSNARVPTSGDPVSIRVNVSAEGYETNSTTVTLRSIGRTDGQILLFRENQGVTGSETGSNSGATNSGVVSESFRTATAPNPTNQAEASVYMAAGTHGTTATGVLASGSLRADIVYYTATTSSTAVAFPGGFDTPVRQQDGSVRNMTLTTAGFMSVNVSDDAGNDITQFDPAIEISMELEPGTYNAATGAPIKNGDSIPFFSFDEEDGVWVEDGVATLSGPGTDGNFLATYLTTHLTTWSAGYTDGGCNSGTFLIERNGNSGSIFARASSASGGWFGRTIVIPSTDSEFNIIHAPSFLTEFEVRFELAGQVRTIQQNNSICGASGVATFDPPDNVVDATFTLDLGPTCSALRVNDVPTFAIFHKLPGQNDIDATPVGPQPAFQYDDLGRITGGQLVVAGLELGQTYRFYTTINNERHERDIRISSESVPFDISDDVNDADICARN